MADNLQIALQITVVGMGLVFGAILLVVLMMYLLVRGTSGPPISRQQHPETALQEDPDGRSYQTSAQRQRAAAAAVAFVLMQASAGAVPQLGRRLTPWQSVMRGRQLKQRGPQR